MSEEGQRELNRAFDGLEREAPDRLARAIRWFRAPESRKYRIPAGVLFIVAGFLWFLPVVGIEFLPVGLLLIAQDVPFLKKPVGKGMLWLENKWIDFKQRRRRAKAPLSYSASTGVPSDATVRATAARERSPVDFPEPSRKNVISSGNRSPA